MQWTKSEETVAGRADRLLMKDVDAGHPHLAGSRTVAEVHRTGRVAWITTDLVALDDPDRDIEPVTEAAAHLGVEIVPMRWRDSNEVDWSSFDLAVIRSPWDYPEHLDAFLDWLARTERRVPMVNASETIRWNLDKSYLVELADAGLPVVPTAICDSVDAVIAEVARLAATGHSRVVIKPNVSAGSRDTGLFGVDDPAASALARAILERNRRVLVQPEVPSVATDGETGMILIDGAFAHAVRKGPILATGGGLIGGRYIETITRIDPSDIEITLAERVVRACEGPIPLYARVDLVASTQGPQLLEAELFEPSLFCDLAPETAERLVLALAERVR